MSGKLNITVTLEDVSLVIRFNGTVHLWLPDRRKLLGVHSWRMEKWNRYYIEFTLEGGVITSDYDDRSKWQAILSGLEKVL